jgi:hypothetical protein
MNRKRWMIVLAAIVCCLVAYIVDPDFHSGYLLFGIPPIIYLISALAIATVLMILYDRRTPKKK